MHDSLVGLLDKADAAVAHSAGVLDPEVVESLALRAGNTRARLSYPEWIVVAALAGGTGSGKSSLLNAFAGEDVALTGAIRPMTSTPLALVPERAETMLGGFLDELGIPDRVLHRGPEWLCLIDLPDNDSVEVSHRHTVDAILPLVDVVAWVTDPEKYRDASLHHGYVERLARYQEQFLFVLNQTDRLSQGDVDGVAADFREALEQDGISAPEIVLMAADPVAGPPVGIEAFVDSLDAALDRRRVVQRKALADLAGVASEMVRSSSDATWPGSLPRWSDLPRTPEPPTSRANGPHRSPRLWRLPWRERRRAAPMTSPSTYPDSPPRWAVRPRIDSSTSPWQATTRSYAVSNRAFPAHRGRRGCVGAGAERRGRWTCPH